MRELFFKSIEKKPVRVLHVPEFIARRMESKVRSRITALLEAYCLRLDRSELQVHVACVSLSFLQSAAQFMQEEDFIAARSPGGEDVRLLRSLSDVNAVAKI